MSHNMLLHYIQTDVVATCLLLVSSTEVWECFPWATSSFELEVEAQMLEVMDSSLLKVQLILENFFTETFKDQLNI